MYPCEDPAAITLASSGLHIQLMEQPRSPWIVAICSVLFDLDVGQRIDSIVPEGALTEEETNDVAFHSFPVRRRSTVTAGRMLHADAAMRSGQHAFMESRQTLINIPNIELM